MKLLYATSVSYPSTLANRLQIAAMAKEFAKLLGTQFVLGVYAASDLDPSVSVREMGRSVPGFILAWRYVLLIRKERFTHVLIREERLLFFLALYARLLRIPVLFFLESHWIRDDWRYVQGVRAAHAYIAISTGIRDDLISHFGISPERILIAHDAVDLDRFRPVVDRIVLRQELGFPPDAVVIAYAGSFGHHHPWKGIDVLADSAQYGRPEWLYVLVGGSSHEVGELQQHYKNPAIRFEAHRNAADIPHLLMAADVLVLPNKKGKEISERHTSPLKLFEYMASSTPIIASDLPSIRDIVSPEEVVFFEPNNPQALAQAIEEVCGNPEAARARASQALAKVSQQPWAVRAKSILAFMEAQT
mgnify:CR=1 FL=1